MLQEAPDEIASAGSRVLKAFTLDAFGPGLVSGEKANHFSGTNNVFRPSLFWAVTDRSGASAAKGISGNLSKKMPAAKHYREQLSQ